MGTSGTIVTVIVTVIILVAGLAVGGTEEAGKSGVENKGSSARADQKNDPIQVNAGGGNATLQYTAFVPNKIQIKQNQSVTWINPSAVPEPHTITFLKDKSQWGNLEAPLVVGNSTVAITPKTLSKGGSTEILRYFGGSFQPEVIKSDGTIKWLLPNATYSTDGTERMINSGWVWPKGQAPPGVVNTNSFTIKFQKTGTYDYLCLLHPWMTGSVVVK
jgi:plastocyanin